MLKKVSFLIAIVAFLLCFSLYFESKGFDDGYELAKREYENIEQKIEMSGGGPRTYEHLADKYNLLCWLLVLFGTGKSFEFFKFYKHKEVKVLIHIVCLTAIFFILYQVWNIFSDKYVIVESPVWNSPYNKLLHRSLTFDWLFLIATIILFVLQIIPFSKLFLKSGTKKENSVSN